MGFAHSNTPRVQHNQRRKLFSIHTNVQLINIGTLQIFNVYVYELHKKMQIRIWN